MSLVDAEGLRLRASAADTSAASGRYQVFVDEYGEYAFELDALHPKELKNIAISAVESEFDMDLVREQQGRETVDDEKVFAFQCKMKAYAENLLDEMNV